MSNLWKVGCQPISRDASQFTSFLDRRISGNSHPFRISNWERSKLQPTNTAPSLNLGSPPYSPDVDREDARFPGRLIRYPNSYNLFNEALNLDGPKSPYVMYRTLSEPVETREARNPIREVSLEARDQAPLGQTSGGPDPLEIPPTPTCKLRMNSPSVFSGSVTYI
jgi:hypothetical protein